MYNPFIENRQSDLKDNRLVRIAVEGDRKSLDELILRHQAWIYNIALRMVWNPLDAEDVTQEVLLKIITKLSTFRGESSFRTWVYRIVANHVLNMKRRESEKHVVSFDQYWESINSTPDMDLPDQNSMPIDISLILEEVKSHCMMAMLLCLDRRKRLVFILGELFGVNDAMGYEILDISKANFRQILSRARKLVYSFMREKCGLIHRNNSCHCSLKARSMIKSNNINPKNLKFQRNYEFNIQSIAMDRGRKLEDFVYSQCKKLFRQQPFQHSPDYVKSFRKLISSDEFREFFAMGPSA